LPWNVYVLVRRAAGLLYGERRRKHRIVHRSTDVRRHDALLRRSGGLHRGRLLLRREWIVVLVGFRVHGQLDLP
jgi:hypothetical protein